MVTGSNPVKDTNLYQESYLAYTVFNQNSFNHTEQTMFFGESVNVARYDIQKYPIFEKLTEKQISFFWRPEEIDISMDRKQFADLPKHEQHIFISNLKYQTLLDSVQTRSPTTVLLPLVSIPELESWITAWAFMESIHSRSYTHILRNVFTNPSEVLDDITINPEILKRATEVSKYYDELHELSIAFHKSGMWNRRRLKKALYMCLVAIYALEGIRFYVSFACSFAFAERKLMEGNAKIIKLIARDETLHMAGTAHIINNLVEDDPDFKSIIEESQTEVYDLFFNVVQQEKDWIKYLFKDGSMLGLNEHMLSQYLDYITDNRMKGIGLFAISQQTSNPLTWMSTWLNSDTVQVAPQETEISSYLVGQVDSSLNADDFSDFEI